MSEKTLISLSRLVALRRGLDVIANNVANITTTGFKAQRVAFQEHLSRAAQPALPSKQDAPVSLVQAKTVYTDFSNGSLEQTGDPINVAIQGDGFFAIQTAEGERYTRNGAFQLDSSGRLITTSGHPVLTTTGPISLSPQEANLAIGADGTVSTNQGSRGRLRIVQFPMPQKLRHAGGNLFRSDERPAEIDVGTVRLVQGALERSNVHATLEMSRLVEVTRSYELVKSMMQEEPGKLQRLSDFPR